MRWITIKSYQIPFNHRFPILSLIVTNHTKWDDPSPPWLGPPGPSSPIVGRSSRPGPRDPPRPARLSGFFLERVLMITHIYIYILYTIYIYIYIYISSIVYSIYVYIYIYTYVCVCLYIVYIIIQYVYIYICHMSYISYIYIYTYLILYIVTRYQK